MCGGGKIPIVSDVFKAVGLGGSKAPEQPAPVVVRETPKADAAADADAATQKAATDKLATTRRRRALSLLATGGGGDTSEVSTGKPAAAAGKQQLGA